MDTPFKTSPDPRIGVNRKLAGEDRPATRPPLCIWHKGCVDGFTSAWVVWKQFGDGSKGAAVEFHEGVYSEDPPDVKDRDVFLVDFSYPESTILSMQREARSILILDHHKTAEEALRRWTAPLEYMTPDLPEVGEVLAYFDMNRSGAGLCWDYFFHDEPRPRIIGFVEDRDLWRFHLLGSREVGAVLYSHDFDFHTWESLGIELDTDEGCNRIVAQGAAILRAEQRQRDSLMHETMRIMKIGGVTMPVCNAPYMWASELGNTLAKTSNYGATYYDRKDGRRVFSLRSVGDFDVSVIAKKYGGGGHRNAAGFTAPYKGWEGEE